MEIVAMITELARAVSAVATLFVLLIELAKKYVRRRKLRRRIH
jgi:hypothetical protein